ELRRRRAPRVPRDLETIVAKATARDPALRYATAGALAEDLRRYVEDRPIRARRISPFERAWRWCRRDKGGASSIGLAALTLVGVAGLAVLSASQQAHLAAARKLYADEQAHLADARKLYADEQAHLADARKLYADEQAHLADEQAEATRKITRLASDLEKESGRLRTALSE